MLTWGDAALLPVIWKPGVVLMAGTAMAALQGAEAAMILAASGKEWRATTRDATPKLLT